MDMSKKISIIVAAYNEEKHIDKCLNSLVAQTYSNIEIIVVDDGSSDSTASIVEKFAEKDSRVKLIVQENAGLASARNSGLKLVTGDYVSFSDADDFVELNMYEILLDHMLKEDVDIVCCGFRVVNDFCKPINSYRVSEESFRVNIKESPLEYFDMFIDGREGIFSACNKLYNYKILQENDVCFFPNKRVFEDVDFNLNYSQYANGFLFIPDLLYNYRITGQSITRGYKKNALELHLTWHETIITYLPWVKDDSARMLKLRKLSAESIIYAISNEVIYLKSVNISDYMKKVFDYNEYKIAYEDVSAEMLSSKYDRMLWKLLKAKKYNLLKIAIKFRCKMINIKNNVLR